MGLSGVAGGGSQPRAMYVGVCSMAGPWPRGGYTFTCACGMPLSFGGGSQEQPESGIQTGLGHFPVE